MLEVLSQGTPIPLIFTTSYRDLHWIITTENEIFTDVDNPETLQILINNPEINNVYEIYNTESTSTDDPQLSILLLFHCYKAHIINRWLYSILTSWLTVRRAISQKVNKMLKKNSISSKIIRKWQVYTDLKKINTWRITFAIICRAILSFIAWTYQKSGPTYY